MSLGSTRAQTLLFKSGFEKGVYLESTFSDDDHYTCEQWIQGKDSESGFTWPVKVLGGTGRLHLIGHDNHKALKNKIETVMGHNGEQTLALYMAQHHKSPVGNMGQCPYSIKGITAGTNDLYIKYWIRLDADYLDKIGARPSWRTFFEWKTKDYDDGTGFRLIAFIYTDAHGKPYWHWQGDANPKTPVWEIENKIVPVPFGEWFLTEFFWHWSEGPEGRAFWRVNGGVIGDHHGPTTRNSKPVDFIMLAQIYGSADGEEVTPKHQWIDDIEIRDGIPSPAK